MLRMGWKVNKNPTIKLSNVAPWVCKQITTKSWELNIIISTKMKPTVSLWDPWMKPNNCKLQNAEPADISGNNILLHYKWILHLCLSLFSSCTYTSFLDSASRDLENSRAMLSWICDWGEKVFNLSTNKTSLPAFRIRCRKFHSILLSWQHTMTGDWAWNGPAA